MEIRNRTRYVAIGLVALAGAAYGTWRLLAGPSVATYAVERADVVQTVVASGRVESPRRVEIGSPVVGTVARVPVEEGQNVVAGQVLVVLDETEARAALDQARFAVLQAEEKLAQLRSTTLPVAAQSLRQAEVNLSNAERALDRAKNLFARGFEGQAALDDAERTRDLAASQLASARVQLANESPGGADERLARAALDQGRASVRAAQARLDYTTITAPVAGTLIARDVEKGAVVQPGKALMVLAPSGATQLVVQLDEKNLKLVRLDEEALGSADAYPDRKFAARVAYINPAVDPTRGTVEVKLDVPAPPPYLLQDMTVSVDIEVARRSAVLALPSDAIRDGDWAMVVRDGHASRQALKIGARGEGKIEILAGLAEGDLVIPATRLDVDEGKPVRIGRTAAKPAHRT